MMDGSGFQRNNTIIARQIRSPKRNAIIIWNESTPALEISRHAISLREAQRKFAMKAAAWAKADAVSISILLMRFVVSAKTSSANDTGTSFTSTKKLRAKTHTNARCASTQRFITHGWPLG